MFVLDNHIVASYDYVLVVGGVGRGFPAYNEEGAATGGGLSGPVWIRVPLKHPADNESASGEGRHTLHWGRVSGADVFSSITCSLSLQLLQRTIQVRNVRNWSTNIQTWNLFIILPIIQVVGRRSLPHCEGGCLAGEGWVSTNLKVYLFSPPPLLLGVRTYWSVSQMRTSYWQRVF